ncbi:MAG: sigma-70 family RNA polymerase sigma factor [Candidatus Goldiibacteriota bacterium]|jgi:RNA polymerase sigma-70 factor (ECF subfamily)
MAEKRNAVNNKGPDMDDDIRLMLGVKAGNQESFNRLVDKYSKAIINYIFRFTGSREDAQDLAQDVFIKVYNSAKNYVPSAKFTTWIYRMANNTAIDYIRKKKSRGIHTSLDEHIESGSAEMHGASTDGKIKPADEMMENEEIAENVRQALLKLPDNQRAAIIMKIYEDKPYSEIAQILGTSIASVESLLFRARQALKSRLKTRP